MKKDVSQVITSLEHNVSKLITMCEHEKNRADEAMKEIEVLKRQLKEKDEQFSALSKEYEAVRLGKNISGETDNKEMKRRVNELIQEVDRCIALLND